MSRKETSNVWSDGLMMDLHPMNTPKTVLTDNLNGTIITYNGNEHLLQNDMGNYKLENCKLNENFVPVGLKEYGDIIYIVSYNPLTKETEIGSYPSPMHIEKESNEDSSSDNLRYAIDAALQATSGNNLIFYDIDNYNYNYVFANDSLKLNPGDQFKLLKEQIGHKPRYEGIEYQIIDSDKKIHDITDKVENYFQNNTNEFKNVPWDVPGWLSFKSRIAEFDSFSTSVTKFECSESVVSIDYKFQFNIDDPIIIKNWNDDQYKNIFLNDLKVKLNQKVASMTIPEYIFGSDVDWQVQSWYNDNIIVIGTLSQQFNIAEDDLNRDVTIEATPYLYENSENYNYSIQYAHLTDKINATFDSFVSASNADIDLFPNVYRFWHSDKNTVGFDFDLRINKQNVIPIIEDLTLYYKPFNVDGSVLDYENLEFSEATVGTIIVDEHGAEAPTINIGSLQLPEEGVYKVLFVVDSERPVSASLTLNDTISKLSGTKYVSNYIVSSKIFSKYYEDDQYSKFTDIPMNTWVNDYINEYLNSGSLSITDVSYTSDKTKTSWSKKDNDYWTTGITTASSKANESFSVSQKHNVSLKFNNTQHDVLKENRVNMWTSLINDPKYYLSGLINSDGTTSNDVNVLFSESSGTALGDWDTSTAEITDGVIKYNTHSYGKQGINFVVDDKVLTGYDPNYTSRTLTTISRHWSIAFYKELAESIIGKQDLKEGWVWISSLTDDSTVKSWGVLRGSSRNNTYGHKLYSNVCTSGASYNGVKKGPESDFDVMFAKVKAGVSNYNTWFDMTWGTKGDGSDYTRFGISSDNNKFWSNKDHDQGEYSDPQYFIIFKEYDASNPTLMFYHIHDAKSLDDLKIFNGCKIYTGSPKDYHMFKGELELNPQTSTEIGCTLKSKTIKNSEWIYSGKNLFTFDNSVPIITWSGEISEDFALEESHSLTSTFDFNTEKQSVVDTITSINTSGQNHITTYSNNTKNDDSFLGFKLPSNPSSNLRTIKQNIQLESNGKLWWKKMTSVDSIQVGSTDSGDPTNHNFGHYFINTDV